MKIAASGEKLYYLTANVSKNKNLKVIKLMVITRINR
jgi:hypothetical protein